MLTKYQGKVLKLLVRRAKNGLARITLLEIAEFIGCKYPTGGLQYIRALAKKGFIEVITADRPRDGNSYRILRTS